MTILEYDYSTIYPNSKLVYKVFFCLGYGFIIVNVEDIFR